VLSPVISSDQIALSRVPDSKSSLNNGFAVWAVRADIIERTRCAYNPLQCRIQGFFRSGEPLLHFRPGRGWRVSFRSRLLSSIQQKKPPIAAGFSFFRQH